MIHSKLCRAFVFLGLLFLIDTPMATCEPFTPHRFISTALSDSTVTAFRTIKDFSEKAPGNTPYLERIELRAGIEGSDDETQQDYRLRFYPRPWGATESSRQLSVLKHKGDELEQELYLNQALKKRYNLVLEYIRCTQLLKLKRALEKVHADRTYVLQKKLATRTGADVGALIVSDNKRIALNLEIEELENRRIETISAIHRLTGSSSDISFSENDLISMGQIAKIAEAVVLAPTDNVELSLQKHEAELADCEFAMEKSKSRDYFRFFEVGRSVNDHAEESISFEIGLRLPFTSVNREEIWDRQTAAKREKFYYEKAKSAASEQSGQLKRRIHLLISQYQILKENNKKGNAINTVRSHITSRGGDPLELLKFKESMLENDIRLSNAAFSVRTAFIELMDIMGQLTQKPLVNYLSNYLVELL